MTREAQLPRLSLLAWLPIPLVTQVLGLVYMCVAVLISMREGGAKGIALAAVEDACAPV